IVMKKTASVVEFIRSREWVQLTITVIFLGIVAAILLTLDLAFNQGEFKTEEERQAFGQLLIELRKAREGDFVTVGDKWYMVKKRERYNLVLEASPQSVQKTKVLVTASPKAAQDGGLTAEDRIMHKDDPAWEANATVHFLQ